MSERLQLRRRLYEELKQGRGRRRKALRRQIHLLSTMPRTGPEDDGSAGVREPRRPYPPTHPAAQEP